MRRIYKGHLTCNHRKRQNNEPYLFTMFRGMCGNSEFIICDMVWDPWHSGCALDCWPRGRASDPAPGASFISKFISFAPVVQNNGLKIIHVILCACVTM